MTVQVHNLGQGAIAEHSFIGNHSLLALARGNEAQVYFDTGRNGLQLGTTLKGHDKTITSVDVSNSGKIVTCSQDRNAIVWEPQADGSWKQTLVLLRINRAATCVRWSPDGSKFAVGSGARAIAVCYFEPENDWWVSKHIKKPIRSTILSVDWHPNSVLLAAGSNDGNARVFSGYIKAVDERPAPSVWGERLPFQTLCGEFTNNTGAWVHSVAFSPSGNALAFCCHDSSIVVAYPSGPDQPPQAVISLSTEFLPMRSLCWTTESQIVAAGYDCHPVVFQGSQTGWQVAYSIDDPSQSKKTGAGVGGDREESALNMFRQLDLKGGTSDDTELLTIHQNTITSIRPYEIHDSTVTKVSTSGVDGQVVIFDIKQ